MDFGFHLVNLPIIKADNQCNIFTVTHSLKVIWLVIVHFFVGIIRAVISYIAVLFFLILF